MSLSELYTLAKLPRVSKTTDRSKITRNFNNEELNIGISGASISNYILKPSPKLIWSHSIPPSFTITSIDQVDDKYVIGIYNKSKKHFSVQIIQRLENDSKVLKEIETTSRVMNIKASSESTIVVLEDSIITFDAEYQEVWKSENLYKGVFSEFIENDIVLTVEHESKKNILNFKLLASSGLEVTSKIIESKQELKNLTFAYGEGILYQFSNNAFTLYNTPHFNVHKTLELSELSIPTTSSSTPTFTSPSSDRLLFTQGNDLYLINTKFNIVLSQISSKSKLVILASTKSKTKSAYRSTTQQFGVVLRESDIAGFSFYLDSNTLRDSLGKKKVETKKVNEVYKAVPSILDIQDESIDINKILKAKDFDLALKTFLNAKEDFYTEKDNVVDSKFINRIIEHIFSLEELPEKSLTYLLTHPLFPTTNGLLSKLRSKPRLLRQAVVTGNVSITELLEELNATDNDDIFKDVIARLLEFPKHKLQFKDLDNFRIVERIISLNYGYELISLLIDASGLFTWSEDLISKLQVLLNTKIEALNSASKTLAVIEQVELKNLKSVQNVPAYSIEKLSI